MATTIDNVNRMDLGQNEVTPQQLTLHTGKHTEMWAVWHSWTLLSKGSPSTEMTWQQSSLHYPAPPRWVIPERQLCILGLVKLQASESLEMYLLEWRHSVVKNIGGTEKLAGQVLEATVVSRRRCWLSCLSPSSRVSPHSQDLTTWMLGGRIVVWSCKDKWPK